MPEAVRTVQNDISGEIYMTKDILVRVRGVQTIGEEEDTVEMITPGTYYVKNGKQYLIYDESLDETGTPTHNTVKVMENRIEVMKRGLVESHMIFEPGRRTTANYRIDQLSLVYTSCLPQHRIHADGGEARKCVDLIEYDRSVCFYEEIHAG